MNTSNQVAFNSEGENVLTKTNDPENNPIKINNRRFEVLIEIHTKFQKRRKKPLRKVKLDLEWVSQNSNRKEINILGGGLPTPSLVKPSLDWKDSELVIDILNNKDDEISVEFSLLFKSIGEVRDHMAFAYVSEVL
jgi:hypothetical protein